jgi:hypothetical protein
MTARQTVSMPLLTFAVATMTLAQLLDLGTFIAMVKRIGLGSEANPMVASLISDYGLPMAAIAKIALIALVVAVTLVLSRRSGRVERLLGAAVITLAIVGGVIGGGSNVLTMGPFPLAR